MSGVFGCYDIKGSKQDVTRDTYYGIFSLQHRGQESCGIAVNDDGSFLVHKASGLVTDVFDEVTLSALAGTCAARRVYRFLQDNRSSLAQSNTPRFEHP